MSKAMSAAAPLKPDARNRPPSAYVSLHTGWLLTLSRTAENGRPSVGGARQGGGKKSERGYPRATGAGGRNALRGGTASGCSPPSEGDESPAHPQRRREDGADVAADVVPARQLGVVRVG